MRERYTRAHDKHKRTLHTLLPVRYTWDNIKRRRPIEEAPLNKLSLRPRSHDTGRVWKRYEILTFRGCVHTMPVMKLCETVTLTVRGWKRYTYRKTLKTERNSTFRLPCERLTVRVLLRLCKTFLRANFNNEMNKSCNKYNSTGTVWTVENVMIFNR